MKFVLPEMLGRVFSRLLIHLSCGQRKKLHKEKETTYV